MMASAIRNTLSEVGDAAAEQRQHAEREGDVGRRRDRPAGSAARLAAVDREIDQRRHRPCRRCRDDRQSRLLPRRRARPTSSSRLISSPTSRKKIAISPSLIHKQQRLARCRIADRTAAADVQQHVVESGQGRIREHERKRRRQTARCRPPPRAGTAVATRQTSSILLPIRSPGARPPGQLSLPAIAPRTRRCTTA